MTEQLDEQVEITELSVETESDAENTECGVVANCSHLIIRGEPSKKSVIVGIIPEGKELVLYPNESDSDWWKVSLADTEGFCMKKYIKVK